MSRTRTKWTDEEIIAVHGQAAYDELVRHYYPPPDFGYGLQEATRAQQLLARAVNDIDAWTGGEPDLTPVLLDLVFGRRQGVATAQKFLGERITLMSSPNGAAPVQERQRRRRINKPETIEKRNQALVKARAARAERLAAARAARGARTEAVPEPVAEPV